MSHHNPWRSSLENCMAGDNYLRADEYMQLIEELDDLYRYRSGQHDSLNEAYANGRDDQKEEDASEIDELRSKVASLQTEALWSGWACQFPGKLPRLYGARDIALLNHHPDEGDMLLYMTGHLASEAQQPAQEDCTVASQAESWQKVFAYVWAIAPRSTWVDGHATVDDLIEYLKTLALSAITQNRQEPAQSDHFPEAGKMIEPAQAGELPPHVATASKGPVAFFVKWTEAGKPLRGEIHLYTEDQMRAALASRKPFDEAQVTAAARCICKRHTTEIGANEQGAWDFCSDDFKAEAREILQAANVARKPLTDEQVAVLRFLLGESGLDDCHFGDRHTELPGNFWWRKHLRDAFGINGLEVKT